MSARTGNWYKGLAGMGLLLALGLGVQDANAQAAPVRMEEVHIGFHQVYRTGHVTPVFVRVRNDLPVPFVGRLMVAQDDDDGERVRWHASLSINATESAWWTVLMIPRPGAIESGQAELMLLDAQGRAVEAFNLRQARTRPLDPPEARVVGVVGTSLGAMDLLNHNSAHLVEPVRVLNVPVARLPLVWQGLDMLDVLYWDDPRPQDLAPEQQQALAQWVRSGGQLVLGLGSGSAEFVGVDTPLSRLMPVSVVRTGQSLPHLHALGRYLLGGDYFNQLHQEASAVQTVPHSRAVVLAHDAHLDGPLLTHWPVGAGSVTVLATTLREAGLAEGRWAPRDRALARLLGLRSFSLPRATSGVPLTTGMGAHLDSAAVGGTLVGLVVLLSVLYAALAGPGVWLVLRTKGRMELSWWVFGGVVAAAIVTSAGLSLAPIRGSSILQAVVVDLDAGSAVGVVRGHMGLYEPSHRTVDLSLREDEFGLLAPMVNPHTLFDRPGGFPDVRTYDMPAQGAAGGGLDLTRLDVPIRRTIKRFRLSWQGDLRGTVYLQAHPYGERDVRGTVRNQLGTPLRQAWLIYPSAADTENPYQVLALGDLEDGATVEFDSVAGPRQPQRLAEFHRNLVESQLNIRPGHLFGWGPHSPVDAARPFAPTAMMLSTLGLYDQPAEDDSKAGPRLTRVSMGCWDRSAILQRGLTQGKAILIAEAPDYMPARIEADGRKLGVTGPAVVRVLADVPLPPARPVTSGF